MIKPYMYNSMHILFSDRYTMHLLLHQDEATLQGVGEATTTTVKSRC